MNLERTNTREGDVCFNDFTIICFKCPQQVQAHMAEKDKYTGLIFIFARPLPLLNKHLTFSSTTNHLQR